MKQTSANEVKAAMNQSTECIMKLSWWNRVNWHERIGLEQLTCGDWIARKNDQKTKDQLMHSQEGCSCIPAFNLINSGFNHSTNFNSIQEIGLIDLVLIEISLKLIN